MPFPVIEQQQVHGGSACCRCNGSNAGTLQQQLCVYSPISDRPRGPLTLLDDGVCDLCLLQAGAVLFSRSEVCTPRMWRVMLLYLSALQDQNETVRASAVSSSFLAIPADRAYRNPQQALTMIAATASAAVQKVRESQWSTYTLWGPSSNGPLCMSITCVLLLVLPPSQHGGHDVWVICQ